MWGYAFQNVSVGAGTGASTSLAAAAGTAAQALQALVYTSVPEAVQQIYWPQVGKRGRDGRPRTAAHASMPACHATAALCVPVRCAGDSRRALP